MKAIAKALVNAVAFLEFSGDDVIDPDVAVQAAEMIGADLSEASEDEKAALKDAARSEYDEQKKAGADDDTLEFYRCFLENFGLEDET